MNMTFDDNVRIDQRHLYTGFLLLLWMALIAALGASGVFAAAPGEPPLAILVAFATSFAAFVLAYRGVASFREYVLGLDMRLLVMLHSWRMLGMGFVMLYLFDRLPGLFAYLAGLGDALAAIGAVVLAYALFRDRRGVSRRWIWRWNTFGLMDFVVAVSIGILTRSEGLLAPASGVNSDVMTLFPFVLIPGFLVQVFALTHVIIYLQLKNLPGQSAGVGFSRDRLDRCE